MSKTKSNGVGPWKVGTPYFIRTITHHFTGKIEAVYEQELLISHAAWIPDDGRFSEFLMSGTSNEVEPFPPSAKVIIGRASIIDAVPFVHALPKEVK